MSVRYVVNGAKLSCNAGSSPSRLTGVPQVCTIGASIQGAATIMHGTPGTNIHPFGECAILKEKGLPPKCSPITNVWLPGQPTPLGGDMILGETDKLHCLFGGIISVADPGQNETVEAATGMDDGSEGSWLHGPLQSLSDWAPGLLGAIPSVVDQYLYGFEGNKEKSQEAGITGLVGLLPVPFAGKIGRIVARRVVKRDAARRAVGKVYRTKAGRRWVEKAGGRRKNTKGKKRAAAKKLKDGSRAAVRKAVKYTLEKLRDQGVGKIVERVIE